MEILHLCCPRERGEGGTAEPVTAVHPSLLGADQEAVNRPSLAVFMFQLDRAWSTLVWWKVGVQGFGME